MLALEAESYKAAVDACRNHLLSCVEAGADKPVRKKWRGDPGIYGGLFVAMCVTHVTDLSGDGPRERPGFPLGFEFEVRFIDLAISRTRPTPANPDPEWESGQVAAEERCEVAYSAFLEGLERKVHEGPKIQYVDVQLTETGSVDRLGGARTEFNNDNTILWAHIARARCVL